MERGRGDWEGNKGRGIRKRGRVVGGGEVRGRELEKGDGLMGEGLIREIRGGELGNKGGVTGYRGRKLGIFI